MRNHDGSDDGQNDEHDSGDLGDLLQLAIQAAGLILAKERLCTAGNGAQALTLALLHEHCGDQHERDQNQYDIENNGQSGHGASSLNISTQHTRVL